MPAILGGETLWEFVCLLVLQQWPSAGNTARNTWWRDTTGTCGRGTMPGIDVGDRAWTSSRSTTKRRMPFFSPSSVTTWVRTSSYLHVDNIIHVRPCFKLLMIKG